MAQEAALQNLIYFILVPMVYIAFAVFFHRHCHPVDKDIPAAETSLHIANFSREKTNLAVGNSRYVPVPQRKTAQAGFMGFPNVFPRRAVASYHRAFGVVGRV